LKATRPANPKACSHRETWQEPVLDPVLRDVDQTRLEALADSDLRHVAAIEHDGAVCRYPQAYQGIGQLPLSVAGDPGHADDLPRRHTDRAGLQPQVASGRRDVEIPHVE
jgi:hypothetical protein